MSLGERFGGVRPGAGTGRPAAEPEDEAEVEERLESELPDAEDHPEDHTEDHTEAEAVGPEPEPDPASADEPGAESTSPSKTSSAAPAKAAPAAPAKAMQAALVVLTIALVGALVVLAAGISTFRKGEQAKRRERDERAILGVASQFAEAILTFDYHDASPVKDKVLPLTTGAFRGDFEREFDASLKPAMEGSNVITVAKVQRTYLGDRSADHATVIVVLDSTGSFAVNGQIKPNVVLGRYVEVSVARVGEREWKVDNLQNLNLTQAQVPTSTGSLTTPDPTPTTGP